MKISFTKFQIEISKIDNSKSSEDKEIKLLSLKNFIALFVLLLFVAISIILLTNPLFTFCNFFAISDKPNEIGDTIGGIATPLLTAISIIILFYAFNAQIKANKLLKEDLDIQKNNNIIELINSKFNLLEEKLSKNIYDYSRMCTIKHEYEISRGGNYLTFIQSLDSIDFFNHYYNMKCINNFYSFFIINYNEMIKKNKSTYLEDIKIYLYKIYKDLNPQIQIDTEMLFYYFYEFVRKDRNNLEKVVSEYLVKTNKSKMDFDPLEKNFNNYTIDLYKSLKKDNTLHDFISVILNSNNIQKGKDYYYELLETEKNFNHI